ncbi:MAG TPA: metallophosphoesterase [Chloroflexota bacterium]|nr:metallophosphoesterase [Chloroflexota bacterium]
MRILAISDRIAPALYDHFDRGRWAGVDLVISCGDLPPEYLDFLGTSLGRPVLFVRGNHDGRRDTYAGFHDLSRKAWTGGGLTIVGFEGCRRYNRGEVQYSEREMAREVRRATRGLSTLDVIVSHAPPLGCNDHDDPCHQGFLALRSAVDRYQPRVVLHGHSHLYCGQRRETMLGRTRILNCYEYALLDLAPLEPAGMRRHSSRAIGFIPGLTTRT